MDCWTTITKEEFFSLTSEINRNGGHVEFSSDKKTCTYMIGDVQYIQSQKYFNNTSYYRNMNAFKEDGSV